MIQQIKRACDEQGKGSEQIVIAVEDIQQSTNINLDAAKVMNSSVMNLYRQIEIMKKEMGVFKIRDNMSKDESINTGAEIT